MHQAFLQLSAMSSSLFSRLCNHGDVMALAQRSAITARVHPSGLAGEQLYPPSGRQAVRG